MNGTKTYVTAVAAVVAIALPGCGDGEYGKNDTRLGAFEIELGQRYESRLRRKNDQEWFKLTTAHAEETWDLIEIDAEAIGSDLVLHMELYDTGGRRLAAESAAAAGESVRYVFPTLPDSFSVRFSGWDPAGDSDHGSSGAYAFKVSNLDANDEYAGNHSWDDAHELELDVDHPGALVSKLEADYFRFTTAHTADTWDEVDILVAVETPEFAARLEILDAEGDEVHVSTPAEPGEDAAHSFVTTGGTFFIRISGWDIDENDDHGSSGSYTLRVRNLFSNDEFAPNHSFDEAHDIELDTVYDGALVSELEADYYRFVTGHTEDEFDTVVIDVMAEDPDLMPHIALYNSGGSRSNLALTADEPGEGVALGWISPGGVRHVRISGWNPETGRDHGSTGAYSFSVRNLRNNDPFMGNHRFEHAHPIELNRDYDAVLLCINETDWFIVEGVEPGASYDVTVSARTPDLVPHVQVFDPARNFIGLATAELYGGDVTATFTSPEDSFVIRMSGWSPMANRDYGSRGYYTFAVRPGE